MSTITLLTTLAVAAAILALVIQWIDRQIVRRIVKRRLRDEIVRQSFGEIDGAELIQILRKEARQ